MNPITNSPIKEAMRQKNENDAKYKENQIRSKLNSDIGNIKHWNYPTGIAYVIMAVIFGILGAIVGNSFNAFIIGAIVGVVVVILVAIWIRKMNQSKDAEIVRLRNEAEKSVRKAYEDADILTTQFINNYDNNVKQCCQRLMKKADTITTMVDHNTMMFQRMVSHSDASSNIRFVEAIFTYKVNSYGISYSYQSKYSNPQDDFNFDKQRFRNLSTDAECEGLAQALAKLTIRKMTSLYPPNSLHINVSHVDSEVTMHYKAANSNFVAARDIY